MRNQEPDTEQAEAAAKFFSGFLANLGVAFVLSLLIGLIGAATGIQMSNAGMGIMLGIIFGDLWASLRGERSWTKFAFYFCAGFAISIFIDLTNNASLFEKGSFVSDLMFFLPMLLIIPAVFMLPVLERMLNLEKKHEAPSREDLKISLVFPIYMCASMAIYLAVPGALYLLDAPLISACVLYALSLGLVVLDVATSSNEARARDLDEDWGPKATSSAEAFANLKVALAQCFASGLFLGTTIYISMHAATDTWVSIENLNDAPHTFIGNFLWGSTLVALSALVMIAVGSVLTAMLALGLATILYRNPLDASDLISASTHRLLAGGMSYVRPHFTEEDEDQTPPAR